MKKMNSFGMVALASTFAFLMACGDDSGNDAAANTSNDSAYSAKIDEEEQSITVSHQYTKEYCVVDGDNYSFETWNFSDTIDYSYHFVNDTLVMTHYNDVLEFEESAVYVGGGDDGIYGKWVETSCFVNSDNTDSTETFECLGRDSTAYLTIARDSYEYVDIPSDDTVSTDFYRSAFTYSLYEFLAGIDTLTNGTNLFWPSSRYKQNLDSLEEELDIDVKSSSKDGATFTYDGREFVYSILKADYDTYSRDAKISVVAEGDTCILEISTRFMATEDVCNEEGSKYFKNTTMKDPEGVSHSVGFMYDKSNKDEFLSCMEKFVKAEEKSGEDEE